TVGEIINTWAPPHENNTTAYINSVASKLGVEPETRISRQEYPELIAAIILHENGRQPYTMDTINAGVALA
ncbi:structural protein P5, partial [Pseudoalteromonas sp. S4492]